MMRRILALAVALIAPAIYSQTTPSGLIPNAEVEGVMRRSVQLIESTSAAVPGLVRAAAPVHENARQALTNIEAGPAGHPGLLYDFLVDLRSYLALADSVPKPSPFPDEARRQFAELRDSVERLQTHFQARLQQVAVQTRSPDRDNLHRYAEANARLSKPAAAEKRVVFFGDSITDGWRLNEYFPGRDFVNRGISGQVTGEMLGRMKADIIDLQPAAMLVLAGTNDIARGTAVSVIENNLLMMADLADTYKIKPLFASVLPVSDYHKNINARYEMTKTRPPATILELNRWIQAFCRQRNYTYVDYFSQLVDASGQLKAELADDGLHPNAAGYRVMAPIAMAALEANVLKPTPVITSKKRAQKPPVEKAPVEKAVVEKAPVEKAAVQTKAEPPQPAPAKAEQAETSPAKQKKPSFWKRTYPSAPPAAPAIPLPPKTE
jgi:lysophospholipase L1-like esterase